MGGFFDQHNNWIPTSPAELEPCREPVAETDTVVCAEYSAHQSDHVRYGDRWRCLCCEPLTPAEAIASNLTRRSKR